MLKVVAVPALRDNYIWVIHHIQSNQCIVVDPGEAVPILRYLDNYQAELSAILVTHYHWDHTEGIVHLRQYFPKVLVYGSAAEALSYKTKALYDGDQLSLLNDHFLCTVYEVPGHTRGHIAYYVPDMSGYPAVFTGDTLFSGGCGRLFEGTPNQLYQSLLRLRQLPAATQVYGGHEYTVSNLKFANWLEPDNLAVKSALEKAQSCRARQKPTLPSLLKEECIINPFLRCDDESFITGMEKRLAFLERPTSLALFAHLRVLKDNWHDNLG